MSKLNILVDMDDCLFDTLPAVLYEYYRRTGEDVDFSSITEWDFSKDVHHPDIINQIFNEEELYIDLELKDNSAYYVLEALNRTDNVYIVSAGTPRGITGKALSLATKLPFIKPEQVFYGWNKGMYVGDILIDDRVLFHQQFQKTNQNGYSIVFDMPHNRDCNLLHYRVGNWNNAFDCISEIKKRMW